MSNAQPEHSHPGADQLGVASDVRFRSVFDEGVVIRQRAAEVLVLNEVGIRILQLVSDKQSIGEIVNALHDEFEVSIEALQADVSEFTEQLEAAGVIERIAAEPSQP